METQKTQYVYPFTVLDHIPNRPTSCAVAPAQPRSMEGSAAARGAGALLQGTHVRLAWLQKACGTASKLQALAVERFMYVREGALLVDIDAQMMEVGAGEVVHIPEGMVHSYVVISHQDAVLIIAECVSEEGGASLLALAGMEDGGRDVGGQYRVPQSPRVSGGDVRYVYRWDALDRVPEHRCSAKVTPRAHVSKKSSSYGAALSGDKIHVGLIRKPRGSGAKLHTHPNEQFNIVLEGALEAEIDGQSVCVPSHHVIHMPAGVVHSTVASARGDVIFFVAKDTRHGLAGPPVDGIEDGPRYLAGFKPQN